MSANLSILRDGRVALVTLGRIPVWHGTGQTLDHLFTCDEADEHAGIFYPVATRKAAWLDDDGSVHEGRGVQIVRTDTNEAIGSASDEYVAIPNEEAIRGIIEPHMKSGQIQGIMSAGVIGRGEKAWAQAIVGEFSIDEVDRGLTTLLICVAHNAKQAVKIGFNDIYVVCGNTFEAANNEWASTQNVATVTHDSKYKSRLEKVSSLIDFSAKSMREHEIAAKELVKIRTTVADAWKLAVLSMPPSDTTLDKWKEQRDAGREISGYFLNQYRKVMHEYFHGPGMDLSTRRDTAFGAWNAITGYVDYARQEKSTPSERSRMILMGSGRDIKQKAFAKAFDLFVDEKPLTDREQRALELCPISS